jgi:hypothetical protein
MPLKVVIAHQKPCFLLLMNCFANIYKKVKRLLEVPMMQNFFFGSVLNSLIQYIFIGCLFKSYILMHERNCF